MMSKGFGLRGYHWAPRSKFKKTSSVKTRSWCRTSNASWNLTTSWYLHFSIFSMIYIVYMILYWLFLPIIFQYLLSASLSWFSSSYFYYLLFFKAFANVAATSYFKLSRLIPASIFNLHFIHLLQLTNEYVKQELFFYYTS